MPILRSKYKDEQNKLSPSSISTCNDSIWKELITESSQERISCLINSWMKLENCNSDQSALDFVP